MKNRQTTSLTLALLLGFCFLLPAMSAQASKKALVNVVYKNQFIAGTTFTFFSAMDVTVTVNTTAGTPTPSVM